MFPKGALGILIQEDLELQWTGKISFAELNDMQPWERDIYISFFIKKGKEAEKNGGNGS